MCIANAKALAETLHTGGCDVFHVSGKGFTNSQHLALPAATYGGGDTVSKLLEKSNLFTSGIGLPLPPVPGDFNAMRLGDPGNYMLGNAPGKYGNDCRLFLPPAAETGKAEI